MHKAFSALFMIYTRAVAVDAKAHTPMALAVAAALAKRRDVSLD